MSQVTTRIRVGVGLLLLAAALALHGGNLPGGIFRPAVGACDIVMVRETADDTPATGRLVVGLQSGDVAAYFESKGHELYLLDDDAKDLNDAKAAMLKSVEPVIAGLVEPALVIVDRSTKRVVHKQSVPADAKATDILAIVKGHGG